MLKLPHSTWLGYRGTVSGPLSLTWTRLEFLFCRLDTRLADVFVSYSSSDRERVRALVESLELQNWTVWWDRKIAPGAGFADEIDREIQDASAVVVIWSEKSIESRWVKSEALDALERDILVPIKIDEVRVPVAFNQIQTVDLIDWPRAGEEEYPQLLTAISRLIKPRMAASKPRADVHSICVNPFRNRLQNPDYEYLADGLTEDLITGLSGVAGGFVLESDTSFEVRELGLDADQIGEALGVGYVLEGSVREQGPNIRVTARFIETGSGRTLFSEHFDRPGNEFYLLQDDLINEIISRMGWQIKNVELSELVRTPVEELSINGLLSKGMYLVREYNWTWEFRRQAMALIDKALALDSTHPRSLAHKSSFLGACIANMVTDDFEADREEALRLARESAVQGGADPIVLVMLGHGLSLAGLYDEGIPYLERAKALAPGLPRAHDHLAYAYIMSGRNPKEGIHLLDERMKRDPLGEHGALYFWKAVGLAAIREYDQAIESVRNSIRLMPVYHWSWLHLALWLSRAGDLAEARRAIVQVRRIVPNMTLEEVLRSTTATSGTAVAEVLRRRLEPIWDEDPTDSEGSTSTARS